MRRGHRMALRVSLGTLLAVGASFFLVLLLFRQGMNDDARTRAPEEIYPAVMYASDALAERVGDDDVLSLAPRLGELGEELHAEVVLVEEIPSGMRRIQGGEEGLVLWLQGGGMYIAAPLRGGGLALAGPMVRPPELPTGMQLLMLVGIALIVGAAGYVLTAPLVRRLGVLERAAVRISDGDLDARAEVGGSDAITTLSERFNLMADRVQELLQSQQALLRAVAHEIRTPIARIRFGGEMLQLAATEEERTRRAEELSGDLDELDELVTEMIVLSRYVSGTRELQPSALDLRSHLEPLVARLSCEVDLELPEGIEVFADARSLRRALRNLLLNASRYGGGRVAIRAERGAEAVFIRVEDDGPGVEPADRERIFEAFVRLDESRDRETGGVGLGLAVVRRIVEIHGGGVWVDASPSLGGARFTTRWPSPGSRGEIPVE